MENLAFSLQTTGISNLCSFGKSTRRSVVSKTLLSWRPLACCLVVGYYVCYGGAHVSAPGCSFMNKVAGKHLETNCNEVFRKRRRAKEQMLKINLRPLSWFPATPYLGLFLSLQPLWCNHRSPCWQRLSPAPILQALSAVVTHRSSSRRNLFVLYRNRKYSLKSTICSDVSEKLKACSPFRRVSGTETRLPTKTRPACVYIICGGVFIL